VPQLRQAHHCINTFARFAAYYSKSLPEKYEYQSVSLNLWQIILTLADRFAAARLLEPPI
jgi:hypothetical protein